jgi:hypothetical protein
MSKDKKTKTPADETELDPLFIETTHAEKMQLQEVAAHEGRNRTQQVRWWIRQEWLKLHPEKIQFSIAEDIDRGSNGIGGK